MRICNLKASICRRHLFDALRALLVLLRRAFFFKVIFHVRFILISY